MKSSILMVRSLTVDEINTIGTDMDDYCVFGLAVDKSLGIGNPLLKTNSWMVFFMDERVTQDYLKENYNLIDFFGPIAVLDPNEKYYSYPKYKEDLIKLKNKLIEIDRQDLVKKL